MAQPLMRRGRCLWLALALALSACGGGDGPEAESQPVAAVAVAKAARVPMSERLSAYGTVEFAPEQLRAISVTYQALVEQVFVSPGQTVKRGAPLVALRLSANSQLELSKARNDLAFAAQERSRLQRLRQERLATNSEVALAEQNAANARAALDNATTRMGAAPEHRVSADADGVVTAITVAAGDVVAPDAVLLRLAPGQQLRVRLGVEPADLARVAVGQAVILKPLYPGSAPLDGRVAQVLRQVDAQTRLGDAVVDPGAASGLLPGAGVRAEVVVRERPAVLAVPRAAVLYEGVRAYVFVVAAEHAARRWVEVGADDGQHVEILSGVSADETVVTSGNHELQDGMAVRIEDATP